MDPVRCKIIKCFAAAKEAASMVENLTVAEWPGTFTAEQVEALIDVSEKFAETVHQVVPTPTV